MQSGKIKRWNQEKGYGFIDVDGQSEDVFFHVSKVRLSQPISVGQKVYFTSERNAKNQLRATEVTPALLSIEENTEASSPKRPSTHTDPNHNPYSQNAQSSRSAQNTRSAQKARSHRRSRPSKKSPFSALFIMIAIIAVAMYLFGDLGTNFLANNTESAALTQSSSEQSSQTGDPQIDKTIALIQQGGPFPYPNKDGTTFYNREGRLPVQSQGYYREYTVPTPGISHRGARRIVTGGNPPIVYYLTVDHYDSFSKLQVK